MRQEQLGTQTPLYHKKHYNKRGQLFDIRLSTASWTTDQWNWNRGALVNYYSSNYAWEGDPSTPAGADNNGNVLLQQHWVPADDAISTFNYTQDLYTYDSLNRIQSVVEVHGTPAGQSPQDYAQLFAYDRWGNRTINPASSGVGLNTKQFTVDAATNRLGVPGGQSGVMSYDSAGNLTTDTYTGAGTRTYDAENRMITAADNTGQTSRYTYDADGNRVRRQIASSQEEWQVYGMDGELLAEYHASASPTAPEKEYGYRNGQLMVIASGEEIQWLVPDHLGTPRIILDQAGNLASVKRHDYLPFGEELLAGTGGRTALQGYTGGDDVRQQFTAKERDNETGLDYFLARYYSSTLGRFTSPDEFTGGPVELFDFSAVAAENPTFYADLTQPQSLNKYHYCLNNPLNYIDPDGHQQALTQRIIWEQGYFQRLVAPIGTAVDKVLDKGSHPIRTLGEVRERVQKALGTDRDSLIQGNMEYGFTREQAEMIADKAIAFNDSVVMGPTKGLKFEQSSEKALISQGYTVTRGDDIAEGMADLLAVAANKRSGIVREVTTSASKSISQIRKQLENGFDYMTSQGYSNIQLQVEVNTQRAASRLRNELGKVRRQVVEVIVTSK